ncbi:hypothetical protein MNL02_06175 [Bartonella krasnovii]|uniref:hypothetical protein n=1 Tax=Bartonella krasnovii TaxID=2267275 RepID=UPI001F4C69C2|nr:hypothetical protein [Bartonella krasnovii]UNF51653.1 hypothetical protein MNL02_06175 [Bartonella krasnovii]
MGLEFVGTFCAVSVCVGVDCTDFVDTFVTGFVGSGILGVDCKLGEGCVTSGCEVTVELGAVSSLEESVGKEETPERLLDLATSVVEAVPAVGASVALVVDGCVPSFLEEASGFVIILASTIGGVVIVVEPDVVGRVGALGVEGGEEG